MATLWPRNLKLCLKKNQNQKFTLCKLVCCWPRPYKIFSNVCTISMRTCESADFMYLNKTCTVSSCVFIMRPSFSYNAPTTFNAHNFANCCICVSCSFDLSNSLHLSTVEYKSTTSPKLKRTLIFLAIRWRIGGPGKELNKWSSCPIRVFCMSLICFREAYGKCLSK